MCHIDPLSLSALRYCSLFWSSSASSRRADDWRDRSEHSADLLGVDADLACRLEVHRVGGRRGIDRDQLGDANQHERLLVEIRGVQRGRSHVLQ